MSILHEITCQRCHRPYPALRSRCPYCGTRKPNDTPRSMPTTDSVDRSSQEHRRVKDSANLQMTIGAVLLLIVLVSVIAVTATTMQSHLEEKETIEAAEVDVAATAPPTATPVPTPSPTPAPVANSVQITFQNNNMEGFMEETGTQIDLDCVIYPLDVEAEPEWTSSDDSVATVDENGVVTVTGTYGDSCVIYCTVGGVQAKCDVWAK